MEILNTPNTLSTLKTPEITETHNLQEVIKNSISGYKSINEGTSESDIASYEDIIGRLIQEKSVSSLAYQICEVQPINSAAAAIFVAKESETKTGNIEIVKQATSMIKEYINTGFTKETYDDINYMFPGQRSDDIISGLLKSLSDEKENAKLLTKLGSIAGVYSSLTLSAINNSETVVFEVSKRVAEVVLKINQKRFRTLQGYAILPRNLASAFLAMGFFNESNSGLLVAQHGKIKYFVNPDETVTDVYVGVVDKSKIGNSSLVFSPYQYILVKSTNSDSGDMKMHLIDRFAITKNPLGTTANPMIYKFAVSI